MKYSGSSFSASSGGASLICFQFCGVSLRVELVTCLTPIAAIASMRDCGLSFRYGIIGSMRIVTGMPLSMSVFAALRRLDGGGACGSMSLAVSSLSVVTVMETIEGFLASRSISRVTRSDFVIICNLHSCRVKTWRHCRVNCVFASILG